MKGAVENMGLPKDCSLKLHSKWPSGKRNLITDVPGVKVGHVTLKEGEINTGVTAVLPHPGNMFKEKVMAGSAVINGFGKSIGLVQVEELGTIETPIIMTNTLSVGTAATGLVKYMLGENPDIGVDTGTVNCLVTECNDGRLNDIRGLHVREEHVTQAIENAAEDFEEGAVGGGTGMICFGFKGGIGSASRIIPADGKEYTIGSIVMSNFGSFGNLVVGGDRIGERIKRQVEEQNGEEKDKGSIIIIIGTDLPLSERQLNRLSRRSALALGRVGSYSGNGSGDIAISFTTANRIMHYSENSVTDMKMFKDDDLDKVFEAAVEAVEEAIVSSLYHAETTTGFRGNTYKSLRAYL